MGRPSMDGRPASRHGVSFEISPAHRPERGFRQPERWNCGPGMRRHSQDALLLEAPRFARFILGCAAEHYGLGGWSRARYRAASAGRFQSV